MHCANKKNKANEQELLIGNYADGQSNDKVSNDKYRTWILACLDQGHRTVNNQKDHSAVHTPSLIFSSFLFLCETGSSAFLFVRIKYS